ncbi:MAG: putative ribosomal RNA small subunit methyltransferase A [Methanocella sp. PtaU1.Bin125]|nr:MAG: putative ribosomal RNA small subunit methyltransferase A [Methanocella sp. PtaU1.Bin125]
MDHPAGADLAPDKRKDQHFLVDRGVLERIVAAADIKEDEIVLEIGAGPGNLTRLLAEKARHVYAVELDPRFAEKLEADFRGSNVTVLRGNALKIELPRFDKAVANLPYSISSDVTFKLLGRPFRFAVLMYQREFAQRMIATVGSEDYSRLSVTVQHFADARILFNVSRRAFVPQPEVESAVVMLTPRPPRYTVRDEGLFMRLVTAAFAGRRKRLRNAILKNAHMMGIRDPKAVVAALPTELLEKRAEQVSPEEFARLADLIAEAMEHDGQDIQG